VVEGFWLVWVDWMVDGVYEVVVDIDWDVVVDVFW